MESRGRPDNDADVVLPELRGVRRLIHDILAQTPLAETAVDLESLVSMGKMLRARLVLRLAPVAETAPDVGRAVAAAVEMVHAATLLHDDVIDTGQLRRGAPSFWLAHGVPGAILTGDMLLCEALSLLRPFGAGQLDRDLIELTRQVCRAEVEQELVCRGHHPDWETSLRFARQKTGALFAFAARAAGTGRPPAIEALTEAGFLAGTAYQVSDDILDGTGDAEGAGKTLGTDAARGKVTAARARPHDVEGALSFLDKLREEARRLLDPFADLRAAWETFWRRDLAPAVERNVRAARPAAATVRHPALS